MTNNDPTRLAKQAAALTALWHANFPIAAAMRLEVEHHEPGRLVTRAPLMGNTNIHATAFAGSLYSAQAMTAWGLLHLAIEEAGLDASLIQADGDIRFLHTVNEDILTTCRFPGVGAAMSELAERGKVRLEMAAEVVAAGEVASRFSGTYVARLSR